MSPVFNKVLLLAFLSISLCNTGCSDTRSELPSPQKVQAKGFETWFEIAIGTEKPRLQLAIQRGEQQQGLMHRRDLGANDGMVFIYKQSQIMSFWMRNTPTPLDIGFFDDEGTLLEIHPLHPFDETPVKSRKIVKFAIEMPRGWYASHNIRPGAKLDLDGVRKALRERGFDPVRFLL